MLIEIPLTTPLQEKLKPVIQFEKNNTMNKDCWIAGGAIRSCLSPIENDKLKDYDVFCRNEDAQKQFIEDNFKHRAPHLENDHMKMFGNVQVINFNHSSIEACIRGFDLTVCQFAYKEDTLYATPEAMIDLVHGRLVFGQGKHASIEQAMRIMRFAQRGYRIPRFTMKEVFHIMRTFSEEDVDNNDYLNKYFNSDTDRDMLIERWIT